MNEENAVLPPHPEERILERDEFTAPHAALWQQSDERGSTVPTTDELFPLASDGGSQEGQDAQTDTSERARQATSDRLTPMLMEQGEETPLPVIRPTLDKLPAVGKTQEHMGLVRRHTASLPRVPVVQAVQEKEAPTPVIRPTLDRLPTVSKTQKTPQRMGLMRRHTVQSVQEKETPTLTQPSRPTHTRLRDYGRRMTVHNEAPQAALARLNSIAAFSVPTREETGQQQDAFITAWIEDIARRETLIQAPIDVKELEAEAATIEKRKAVASTAGGAAIAGLGDAASAALRYISTVLMTNLFAPAIYGTFVEANTVVTVLGYAAKLGLDSVILRFLSTYRAKGERDKAAGLVRFAISVALLSGLIWGAAFFVLAFVLAHGVFHKDLFALPFKEASLLVPFIGIQLVLASGLQAVKAIKWKVYVDRLIQPGLTLLLLIVFYFLGLKLEALIFATVLGYLASIIAGYLLLGKATKKIVQQVQPAYDLKMWVRFALPMFFNSMIRNVLNSTDVLFLGALATQSQLAFYGAADRVSYFVVAPLIALNAIFSPMIAEYHAKGQQKQLESMFKVVTKWSFSLSWPVFLCFTVFHEAILGVFGKEYTQAGLVLILLSLGNLVDAGVGSVNYLLVMTGRPRVILFNTVTTMVVNITLAVLLVSRLNILGAALAAALTVIILNLVGLIEVYWFLKIHPYRWDICKPLLAGIVAAALGLLLTHVIPVGYGHKAIFGALALVLPFMAVYVGVLAVLRFSEEDMLVFDTIRAKFGKKKGVAN
jgi:O-antigen/teichoic acid export membrane protein